MHGAKGASHDVKVAVVIPTHWDYRMGGSQYQAKLLIEQLHKDHAAIVTYFTARAPSNRHFDDHRVVCVGHTNRLRRFGHFWDYFRLQNALRAFAPDVIYQRVGCAYTGISVRYAKRAGVPMIWHVASEQDCSKAPGLPGLVGRPHAMIETRLAKRGATHADVVVAQSEDQIRMLRENFGRQRIRMIRNFHPVPPVCEKRADRITVVWVGNLKPVKRPGLFLEIASKLQGLAEVEFLMVGRGYASDSLQRGFDQAMTRQNSVKFLGAMTQEEVNALLGRAHILVNTSQSEGFSNTFIQAWLSSVPVLTLGVNPDGLLDGRFLGCSFDSTSALAGSIRELAANSGKLKDMGKGSREYAIRHFSMENAAELADLIIRTASELPV